MNDSIHQPEEILDDTVVIDFDTLDEVEEALSHMDRGFMAARSRAMSHKTQSRSLDGEHMEGGPIDLKEIEGITFIDEDWQDGGEVFTVSDVAEGTFMEDAVIVEDAILDIKAEKQLAKLDLGAIVQEPLSTLEHFASKQNKNQIYLHHTVSPGDPMISIRWWRMDRTSSGNRKRVATFAVIAGREKENGKYTDGQIYQCFSSAYWAHHLYIHSAGNRGKINSKYRTRTQNTKLNKESMGIELASWGPLKKMKNGRFAPVDHYNSVMKKHEKESFITRSLPASQVIKYPKEYRGFTYFERYTDNQLESTRQLLVYLCDKYNIPTKVDESIFKLSEKALQGDKGIFTHTSVRADKSDCHPQPELIDMLKSL
ncbi:MAG: N-acetylmuramoyl-L-alanine amidase [Bacteroidota bacterium]